MFGINANGQGISSHLITEFARALQARSTLIINESKAAADALTVCPNVIFRMKDTTGLMDDDHAHEKHDPAAFVDLLHRLAPEGAGLYLGNEPGSGNLSKLNEWTLRAVDRCVAYGRRPYSFNFEVTHPRGGANDWRKLRPAALTTVQAGGEVCIHIYINRTVAQSAEAFQVVNECRDALGDVPICVTEYGIAINYDPYVGWMGQMSQEAVIEQGVLGLRKVNDPTIDFLWFIFGRWDANPSFAITHAETIQQGMMNYNRSAGMAFDWGAQLSNQRVKLVNAASVNFRNAPSKSGAVIASLKGGEVVRRWTNTLAADGERWWKMQLADGRTGYASSQYVNFENAVPTPPDGALLSLALTADEVQQLISKENEVANLHRQAGALNNAIATNSEERAAVYQKALDRLR